MLGVGLEPTRALNAHWILSPVRLPIPPSERESKIKYYFQFIKVLSKKIRNSPKKIG